MLVDLRPAIAHALRQSSNEPFAAAAKKLLETLGYHSERTLFGNTSFHESKALFEQWPSVELLFQLTDEELSGHTHTIKETNVDVGLLRSYLFFAIELRGAGHRRDQLTDVARQINGVFLMPVVVFMKHATDKGQALSITVINERQNNRDVAKVTIIHNITLADPHCGHLDTLNSVALKNLEHPERLPIDDFDRLHETWERIFDVERLNKRFYQEIANWYFWALDQENNRDERNATSLLRLLIRTLYCWFLNEKVQLIGEEVYVDPELRAILQAYKFTMVENTPIDHEIAIDPELLGTVFETLLNSDDDARKTTTRKQTGSFYTPRAIVNYMVDEALKVYLSGALVKAGMREGEAREGIELLLGYTDEANRFGESDVQRLLEAIHACRILDPSCGSGAFPMGALYKLVHVIRRLDPGNVRWKQLQIDAATRAILDPSARDSAIKKIEDDFANNSPEYGRKSYVLERCLYGVDIQPLALEISKLRLFLSLISEQHDDGNRENQGIRPLPNVEAQFVVADALVFDWGMPSGFDIIVGNPPYVGFRDLDPNVKSRLKRTYTTAQGKFDLYVPFVERGSQLLSPGGILTYLLPTGFAKRDYGSAIRQFLIEKHQIDFLVDFGHEQVFDAALSYTGVLQIQKKTPSLGHSFNLRIGAVTAPSVPVLQSKLTREPWFLAGSEGEGILERMKRDRVSLGDLAVISEGVVTGFNGFYLIARGDAVDSSSVFKPCLRGREIRRYMHVEPEELLFYPYEQRGGKTVPLPESEVEKMAPSFLARIRKEKRRILARPYFAQSSKNWYELWNQRSMRNFESEKVITPELADRARFAVAGRDIYYGDTVCGIIPKNQATLSPFALVAILNSSVVQWYYKKATVPKANGFFVYKVMYLKHVPIPMLEVNHHAVLRRLGFLICTSRSVNGGNNAPATRFVEELIDACVMECYFREHMAQRDLLFLDEVARHLDEYDTDGRESKQREFLEHFHRTLDAPAAKVHNRLSRILAASPELLGVVLGEKIRATNPDLL